MLWRPTYTLRVGFDGLVGRNHRLTGSPALGLLLGVQTPVGALVDARGVAWGLGVTDAEGEQREVQPVAVAGEE